jgi:hypothetical protein
MIGLRLVTLCLAAMAALASAPAVAHGALRAAENACVLRIGPDLLYFAGYQPALSRRKFCEDIPTTGDTIFALDYAQQELREMTADFRIIRDTSEEDEAKKLDKITVAYLPPKVYPNGTINFEHDFKETGDFVGIVTLVGPHGEHWVSRFPFSVGRLYPPQTPYYLIAFAVVAGAALLLWGRETTASATPG